MVRHHHRELARDALSVPVRLHLRFDEIQQGIRLSADLVRRRNPHQRPGLSAVEADRFFVTIDQYLDAAQRMASVLRLGGKLHEATWKSWTLPLGSSGLAIVCRIGSMN